MTPKELKALTKEMRKNGVTHLKTAEFELKLGPAPQPKAKKLSPEEETAIKHKVENLKSVMSLADTELIDRLFPDHTQEDEAH